MLFKINPQSFNAVVACAAKNDVRDYLNTFYVDTDNNRLVATNGHVMAIASLIRVETGNVDAEPDKHLGGNGFLFKFWGKPISNSGGEVFIDCAKHTLTYFTSRETKTIHLEKCDGKFPDYDRVKYVGKSEAVTEIAFQPEYIAKPLRWADIHPAMAVFSFNGEINAMGVRFKDPKLIDVEITLMPRRI